MLFEHDYEPTPGLPAPLPDGETILWQGSPSWSVFARRALKIRWLAGYFVALIVFSIADRLTLGQSVHAVVMATLVWAGLAAVALGLLLAYAYSVGRTTLYTITTRRLLLRIGVALPVTLQIPFGRIDSADVKAGADGAGDIALSTIQGDRISYLVLWPHARPWTIGHAQPSLRGLANVGTVAQILSRALAAAAEQPAQPVRIQVKAASQAPSTAPAAA